MKLLNIDSKFYAFPKGINGIEEFILFVKQNYYSFIEMTEYLDENCQEPFFIEEDKRIAYLNLARIERFFEFEGEVLSRKQYDKKLIEIANKKCLSCMWHNDTDTLDTIRPNLCLDGSCWRYEKKD